MKDFDELVDAYRDLAIAHAETQAELEKLRLDMRECWAEFEKLRSLDRAQRAERDEGAASTI